MIRIKELRVKNGWLQSDLGARLHIGKNTISRYETGERSPDVETILALCEIFNCSADYLLGRPDPEKPKLSDEEWQMVVAFREADEDAQEIVRRALRKWTATENQKQDAVS